MLRWRSAILPMITITHNLRAFQNGSEAVKTPRCGEALYMTVCALSELGGFADNHDYAQPEGVSKRFRGGENAKMRRSAIHDGMRFVGAWRFCRLLSVLGHPCIKRFGTPVYQAFWDALFFSLKEHNPHPWRSLPPTDHRTDRLPRKRCGPIRSDRRCLRYGGKNRDKFRLCR